MATKQKLKKTAKTKKQKGMQVNGRQTATNTKVDQLLAQHQRFIELAPDPIIIYDTEGCVGYVNPAFEQTFGWTLAEIAGERLDFVPEANREETTNALTRLFKEGKVSGFQTRRLTKDKKILDIDLSGALYFDENGDSIGSIIISRDHTQQKETERALEASQNRYQQMLEETPDAYYEVDLNGSITVYGKGLAKVLGYPEEELIGLNNHDYVDPANVQGFYDAYNQVYKTGIPTKAIQMEIICKDGSTQIIETSISLIRDEKGDPTGFRGIARDVTDLMQEQWQAEQALADTLIEQERTANQLATVAQVSTAVSTILDPQEMLQAVVDLVKESFNLYHAHIYLLNEAEGSLTLAAGAGQIGHQMVAEGRDISLSQEQSLVARAARGRAGVIVNDVRAETGFLSNPHLPQTRAEMAVPMLVGGQLLGVLDVQADVPNHFTQRNITVQTTLAAQVAVALQNARQYEQIQLQNRALNSAANGIAITDREGIILWVNEAFTQLTQYSAEEAIGQNPRNLSSGRQATEFYTTMWNTILGGKVWQGEIINKRKDGSLYTEEITITPVRAAGDEITHFISIMQDISERKKAELALQEREEDLVSLLEFAPEAIGVVNTKTGLFESPNANAERLYGLSRDELIKVGLAEMSPEFQPDGRPSTEAAMEKIGAAMAGEPQVFEWTHCNAAGDEIPCEIRLVGLPGDRNHHLVRFSVTDITERIQTAKVLETALSESERLYEMSTKLNATTSVQDILENALLPALGKAPTSAALLTVETENGRPLWAEIAATWYREEYPYTSFPVGTRLYLPNFPGADRWIDNPDEVILIGNIDEDETINPAIKSVLQMGGFKASVTMPLFTQGQWVGFTTISWDTPRQFTKGDRRIYQALAEQTAVIFNNQILFNQTQKRANELATVAEIGAAITTIRDVDDLLQQVVDLSQDRFDLYQANIYLMNNSKDRLVLASGSGKIGRQMAAEKHLIPLHQPQSIIARAARSQQSVIVNDITEDAGYLVHELLPDTKSEMALPILIGDELLGIVDVQSDRLNRFNDDDIRTHSTLTAQIGVALQNARSFSQSEAALNELEELTRRLQHEGWENYMESSFDQDVAYGYDLKSVSSLPKTAPKPQKKSSNGAPLLAKPLLVQGLPIGELTLAEPESLAEDAADIMSAVAERLSAHIENLRLSEQTQRALSETEIQAQRLVILNEISTELGNAATLAEVYDIAVTRTAELLRADRVSLPLLLPDGENMQVIAFHGYDIDVSIRAIMPLVDSPMEIAIKENRLVHSSPVDDLQTVRIVPLVVGSTIIGTLNIGSMKKEFFDERDESLLQQMATILGSIIENKRLLGAAQSRAQREQMLREVATRIRSSSDVDTIMRTAVQEIGQALGRQTFVYLGSEKDKLVEEEA